MNKVLPVFKEGSIIFAVPKKVVTGLVVLPMAIGRIE